MDDAQITTLEQIRSVLESPGELEFKGASREERYGWIEEVLKRFDYFRLAKKGKGLVKAYIERMSGISRAQVTRLVLKKLLVDAIKTSYGGGKRFAVKYTVLDHELLAQTDNLHERLSGPATRRILERQYKVYGNKRFERLSGISSSHIYNLRGSRTYRLRAQTFVRTKSVSNAIGIRRKPEPQGRPGYIRVDTVHQGDLNGKKGVYHINLVDAVTQWEIVVCVETISEAHLLMILEEALAAFPFVILGFHSDNGSEYINVLTATLLNKLLIEQTKSRSGRTNDNALVEGKNGSVIRKHMGHSYIEQKYAPLINRFYMEYFNTYLNFHRPCGFATVTVDDKGKRSKKYEIYQTPHERLKSLVNAARSRESEPDEYLRKGVNLEALDRIAAKQTDNEFARVMQGAKERLFKKLGGTGLSTQSTAIHSTHKEKRSKRERNGR
ncbi:MAG: DDE-type integrase/transposase/recombinase [Pseudomonadota bacterium]